MKFILSQLSWGSCFPKLDILTYKCTCISDCSKFHYSPSYITNLCYVNRCLTHWNAEYKPRGHTASLYSQGNSTVLWKSLDYEFSWSFSWASKPQGQYVASVLWFVWCLVLGKLPFSGLLFFCFFFFFSLVCTTSKIIFSSASASPLGGTSRNNPARSRLQILSQSFPPEVILPLGRRQGDLAEPLLLRAKRTRVVGGSSSGNGTFFTLAWPWAAHRLLHTVCRVFPLLPLTHLLSTRGQSETRCQFIVLFQGRRKFWSYRQNLCGANI